MEQRSAGVAGLCPRAPLVSVTLGYLGSARPDRDPGERLGLASRRVPSDSQPCPLLDCTQARPLARFLQACCGRRKKLLCHKPRLETNRELRFHHSGTCPAGGGAWGGVQIGAGEEQKEGEDIFGWSGNFLEGWNAGLSSEQGWGRPDGGQRAPAQLESWCCQPPVGVVPSPGSPSLPPGERN